jgi:hypothetical protein
MYDNSSLHSIYVASTRLAAVVVLRSMFVGALLPASTVCRLQTMHVRHRIPSPTTLLCDRNVQADQPFSSIMGAEQTCVLKTGNVGRTSPILNFAAVPEFDIMYIVYLTVGIA